MLNHPREKMHAITKDFAILLNIKHKLWLKSWLCVLKIFATKPEFDLWEPLRGWRESAFKSCPLTSIVIL